MTSASGLIALSPITSCNSGVNSLKLSDRISSAGPKNVPGNGPDEAYDGPASFLYRRIVRRHVSQFEDTNTVPHYQSHFNAGSNYVNLNEPVLIRTAIVQCNVNNCPLIVAIRQQSPTLEAVERMKSVNSLI